MKLFAILLWISTALLAGTEGQWQGACNALCGGRIQTDPPLFRGGGSRLRGRAGYPFEPPPGQVWPGYWKDIHTPVNYDRAIFFGNGVIGTVHKELQRQHDIFNANHDCSKRHGRNYCNDYPTPPPDLFSDLQTGSSGISCTGLLCFGGLGPLGLFQ